MSTPFPQGFDDAKARLEACFGCDMKREELTEMLAWFWGGVSERDIAHAAQMLERSRRTYDDWGFIRTVAWRRYTDRLILQMENS